MAFGPTVRRFPSRAELYTLVSWWDAGAPVPLLLLGGPGSGRSTLLREVADVIASSTGNPHAVLVRPLRDSEVVTAEELSAQVSSAGRVLIALDDADAAAHGPLVK